MKIDPVLSMQKILVLLVFLIPVFVACSSGDGGIAEKDHQTPQPGDHSGVLLDGPVSGVQYATETIFGTTNDAGEFLYKAGENVVFSIGSIVLGQAASAPRVTLIDIVPDAYDSSHRAVINLARFLQTLDADGNPGNGIEITNAVRQAATGITLNFNDSVADFETNDQLLNLIFQETGFSGLVSIDSSLEHFNATLQTIDHATFQTGEHFTGWPKLVWSQDSSGNWQYTLAANQNGPPYYLSILRRDYGLSAIIDQKLTSVDTGYPAEIAPDGKSVSFEATDIFEKVGNSGSTTLWNWECAIVVEYTTLKNYMHYQDNYNEYIVPFSGNDSARRPIITQPLTCSASVLDDNFIKLSWGDMDVHTAIYYQTYHILAISFSAQYL